MKFISGDIFQTSYFIENKGQFDSLHLYITPIDFYTESGSTQYYLTSSGMHIILNKAILKKDLNDIQSDIELTEKNEIIDMPEKKNKESEEEQKYEYFHEDIELHWLNCNPNPKIETEQKSNHYFSYGNEAYMSYGYKKLTYKNIYDNVDLVYQIDDGGGVKYSLILHPGARIEDIEYEYIGQDISIVNQYQSLVIKNEIEDLLEKDLNCTSNQNQEVEIHYQVNGHKVSFGTDNNLDLNSEFTIDPWIGAITSLSNTDRGFDVDYDYAGNLYVYGGGDFPYGIHPFKVAKYDNFGSLLWTFSGTIVMPLWNSGGVVNHAGNFVANKGNGSVYIGQGLDTPASLVRLRTDANYDSFQISMLGSRWEIWELGYDCSTSNILAFGGSTSEISSLGIVDTITRSCLMRDITGDSSRSQDIVSWTEDPSGNKYVVMATIAGINDNCIMKLNTSLTALTWKHPTGFSTFVECDNKAYFSGSLGGSNGFNCLAANSTYLFYYDGLNLRAYNNLTGLPVGDVYLISGYTPKMQGGIYADNCNHVFVGGADENVKVFTFDGTTFNAEPEIVFFGHSNKSVYDIKYNPQNDLFYLSGEGFVANFASDFHCSEDEDLQINVSGSCPSDAFVRILNFDSSIVYTFIWTDTLSGSIVRQTNNVRLSKDSLFGLLPGHYYTVAVIAKDGCFFRKAIHLIASSTIVSDTFRKLCVGDSISFAGHYYMNEGVYEDTVHLTTCDSIARLYIFFYPNSDDALRDTSICLGKVVNLKISDALKCLWSTGDTTSSINVSPNFTSSYNVIITDSNNCSLAASGTVSIFSLGTILEAIPDTIISSGESVWLHAIYSFVDTSILWSPNGSLSNVDSSYTLASPHLTTTYAVIITDSNGCKGMDSIRIVVNNEGSIHTAKAFSPNGDGHNDHFTVFAKGLVEYNISIFNRWGERVYFSEDLSELNNLDNGWDGTFKGKIQDIGTFVYLIKARDVKDNSILTKGNLELMK